MTIELSDGMGQPRRTPPCVDIDTERDVLGAVMLDESEALPGATATQGGALVWPRISALLTPADFYDHRHSAIFAAMVRAKAAGKPLTTAVMVDELRADNCLNAVGGAQALGELAQSTVSITNADRAALIVAELAAKRRLGTVLANNMRQLVAGASLREVQSRVLSQTREVRLPGAKLPTIAADIDAASKRLERRARGEEREMILRSSLDDLNDALEGGYRAGLNLIGARPFIGKTLLTTQEVVHIARSCGPVVYVSLEQRRDQIIDGMTSYLSGIPLELITHADRMSQTQLDRVERAMADLYELPITIYDKETDGCPLTVPQLDGVLTSLPARPVMVGLDHIRKFRPVGRHSEVRHGLGEIAEGLHELALSHGVAINALIHIGRSAVKGTTARVPTMEDLKDSGDLEESADSVVIMHNEGRYPTQKYAKGDEPSRDFVEIFVPKLRGGRGGGYAKLRLQGEVQRFHSTLARDPLGFVEDDDRIDPRASLVQARAPGPVSTGDDVLDRYGAGDGLPDVGAPEPLFDGRDDGPQYEEGAA